MSTTVAVRFVGNRLNSWAAFITVGNGPEVRVSLDRRNRRPWKCDTHGRQAGPDCPHTDAADAANELRRMSTA